MEVLRIDSSESIRYCGVWTTNGYGMPVRGSAQKLERQAVPTEGDEEIVRDVALRQPQFGSTGAVDLDVECRRVHDLVHMDIGQASDACQPCLEVLGHGICGVLVDASDPHVIGAGKPKLRI